MIKIKSFLLSLLLVQSLVSVSVALADTGPKPEWNLHKQLLRGSNHFGALECDQPDCSDASPLREMGPQRFTCDANSCSATAYGFAPYHRIEIQFSDGKTRQGNIFQTAGFASSYTVTVRPDDLLVEAEFSLGFLPPFFLVVIACICAFVGLALVVGFIIFLLRRSKTT
jgi:hypothetical protein